MGFCMEPCICRLVLSLALPALGAPQCPGESCCCRMVFVASDLVEGLVKLGQGWVSNSHAVRFAFMGSLFEQCL